MDAKAEKLALFRYGAIASLVIETLPRGELTRRAQEIAARHFDIPDSKRTAVSVDTLLDWAGRYRNGGFEALAPKPRQDRGESRAVTPQLASLIERLKRENPHRTGTTLLRELALSAGKDAPAISPSTLYRFLKQRGLSERQLLAPQAHKKFEAEFSNQIWQADMLFGPWVQRPVAAASRLCSTPRSMTPAASSRMRSFIPARDSMPRWIVCATPWQHVARRFACISTMPNLSLARTGSDRGIARHFGDSLSSLSARRPWKDRVVLSHATRSIPRRNLDPKHPLSLDELNDRLWIWIENVYHRSEHSALGTTPLLRWQRDIEQVRQLPPSTDLRLPFFHRLDRLVRRDSTLLLHNRLYGAPPHLAGHTVEEPSILSTPRRSRSGFRENCKPRRGQSIRWSTASCLSSNQFPRPSRSPPASTSSNCSNRKARLARTRSNDHVGSLLRFQKGALRRQSRSQTAVPFSARESGQSA